MSNQPLKCGSGLGLCADILSVGVERKLATLINDVADSLLVLIRGIGHYVWLQWNRLVLALTLLSLVFNELLRLALV